MSKGPRIYLVLFVFSFLHILQVYSTDLPHFARLSHKNALRMRFTERGLDRVGENLKTILRSNDIQINNLPLEPKKMSETIDIETLGFTTESFNQLVDLFKLNHRSDKPVLDDITLDSPIFEVRIFNPRIFPKFDTFSISTSDYDERTKSYRVSLEASILSAEFEAEYINIVLKNNEWLETSEKPIVNDFLTENGKYLFREILRVPGVVLSTYCSSQGTSCGKVNVQLIVQESDPSNVKIDSMELDFDLKSKPFKRKDGVEIDKYVFIKDPKNVVALTPSFVGGILPIGGSLDSIELFQATINQDKITDVLLDFENFKLQGMTEELINTLKKSDILKTKISQYVRSLLGREWALEEKKKTYDKDGNEKTARVAKEVDMFSQPAHDQRAWTMTTAFKLDQLQYNEEKGWLDLIANGRFDFNSSQSFTKDNVNGDYSSVKFRQSSNIVTGREFDQYGSAGYDVGLFANLEILNGIFELAYNSKQLEYFYTNCVKYFTAYFESDKESINDYILRLTRAPKLYLKPSVMGEPEFRVNVGGKIGRGKGWSRSLAVRKLVEIENLDLIIKPILMKRRNGEQSLGVQIVGFDEETFRISKKSTKMFRNKVIRIAKGILETSFDYSEEGIEARKQKTLDDLDGASLAVNDKCGLKDGEDAFENEGFNGQIPLGMPIPFPIFGLHLDFVDFSVFSSNNGGELGLFFNISPIQDI